MGCITFISDGLLVVTSDLPLTPNINVYIYKSAEPTFYVAQDRCYVY